MRELAGNALISEEFLADGLPLPREEFLFKNVGMAEKPNRIPYQRV